MNKARPHEIKLSEEVVDVMDIEIRHRKETFRNFGKHKVYGRYYECILDDGSIRALKTADEVRKLAEELRGK